MPALNENQVVSEITNNLSRLIPLGVLFFLNVPRSPSLPAEAPDGWRWFDVPYLGSRDPLLDDLGQPRSFAPIVLDLCYLIERLRIRVTFKTVRVHKGLKVAVLRVYAIPIDVENARFVEKVRSRLRFGKSDSWNVSKYKMIMKKLLSVLDYSQESWEGCFQSREIPLFDALGPFEWFDVKSIGTSEYIRGQDKLGHDLLRLTKGQKFESDHNTSDQSLESRVTDVYNAIEFKIDRSTEYYYEVQNIKGLKSTLYNYQLESVAKMLERESQASNQLMPHLLTFTKINMKFYLDTIDFSFKESPEYYSTPRGGILAENMGLGKTCICLALIVHTKYEFSETPGRYVFDSVRDFKVRSLLEQSARVINRRSIPWRLHLNHLPSNCVKELETSPGYFYFKKDGVLAKNSHTRAKPIVREEKLLLSSTTLIVCPDNLFNQWEAEISKHVEEGALKVLKLQESKKVPQASKMISFDVVLMSTSAYVSEIPSTSELSRVYWKRFIIDEGHSMNQRSTRAVALSRELKTERKWAVTGTPTSGMTELHMNESSELDTGKGYTVRRRYNPRDDLSRLGSLITNFFKIEPFATQNDLWAKNIVKPFVENIPGSEHSLIAMLDSIVVRHSTEQVETDVTLPPLFNKPVFLEPSFHNKLSVNLFTAVLAINAVSSEREDRDYMFHPSNKADLGRLVTNLQRSTFYWTGFSIEDLKSMLSVTRACIDKKNEDGSNYYNDDDMGLLKRSIKNCKIALGDKIWRLVSTIHEMSYYVGGLNKEYHKNFGIGKFEDLSIFGAPQLYSLQKFFFRHRFLQGESLAMKLKDESSVFWNDYWKEATKKNAERAKKNDGQSIEIPRVNEELDNQERLLLKSPKKSQIKYEDPLVVRSVGGRIDFNSQSNTPETESPNIMARIQGTASAKLSYMVSRLLEHQYSDVKSIVFFEFEDSAYYLSEALDVLGLNYTLYATSVPKHERQDRINQFKDSPAGHCLVMDIRLASHGLTITEATRVYFLNPVWKKSVEAQAIKRAHRIGQTSAVYVETLILKGTLEEEMFKHKLSHVDDEEANTTVSDDVQIQEYITKFEFLKSGNTKLPYSEFKSENCSGLKVLNKKVFGHDELLEHTGYLEKNNITNWKIPVFSRDAQHKISRTASEMTRSVRQVTSKVIEVEEYWERQAKTVKLDDENKNIVDESNDVNGDDQKPRKKVRFS